MFRFTTIVKRRRRLPPHSGAGTTKPVTKALPQGLNLRVTAKQLGSLKTGNPVLYRQVQVGSILGSDLSDDGEQVHIYLNILPEFAKLVRANSRFWNVSGIEVKAGLFSGINIRTDSAESILAGGIAFATSDKSSATAKEGESFTLHDDP